MIHRRSKDFRGDSRTARLTEWSTYGGASAGVASGGATLISSISFEDPGTLIRTRGIISVAPQAFGADLLVTGCYGAGIVSAEALAVGITAIPTPVSDADWGGWMVIEPFSLRVEFSDATGIVVPASVQVPIDSKAMRKVEPNEAVVFVAESLVGAYNIVDMTRLLLKLP